MYLDIDKLKEETKDYLNSEDPEFLAKCSEKRWNNLFEKKIHGKVNNLINNLLNINDI
jgi:hypothetical protein